MLLFFLELQALGNDPHRVGNVGKSPPEIRTHTGPSVPTTLGSVTIPKIPPEHSDSYNCIGTDPFGFGNDPSEF